MSSPGLSLPRGLCRLGFPSLHGFNNSDKRVPQLGLRNFADTCRRSISVTSIAISHFLSPRGWADPLLEDLFLYSGQGIVLVMLGGLFALIQIQHASFSCHGGGQS